MSKGKCRARTWHSSFDEAPNRVDLDNLGKHTTPAPALGRTFRKTGEPDASWKDANEADGSVQSLCSIRSFLVTCDSWLRVNVGSLAFWLFWLATLGALISCFVETAK